jgi:hypothetical protein
MEDHQKVIEAAQTIRSMIEQENKLLNDRINWLVSIQGLLFAGLSFSWDKKDASGLVFSFTFLGIVVALSAYSSFPFYSQSLKNLIAWWDSYRPSDYDGPDVVGFRSAKSGVLWFLRPWRALPFIFVTGWVFVLLFHLARL